MTRPAGAPWHPSVTRRAPNGGFRYRFGMADPVAYFITFACYGRRLHGDDRGSVDRFNNAFGEDFVAPSRPRELAEGGRLKWPPMSLEAAQRTVVEDAVREACAYRGWTVHVLNVRTNHVHVVVTADAPAGQALGDLKRYATRALTKHGLIHPGRRPWAAHGSTRYIWDEEQLFRACAYVTDGQGPDVHGAEESVSRDSEPVGHPTGTDRRVGLCSICTHAQRVISARGTTFWLCGLAKADARFRKYPALPVQACSGFAS